MNEQVSPREKLTADEKAEHQRILEMEQEFQRLLESGVFEIIPFTEGPHVFIYNRIYNATSDPFGPQERHFRVKLRECINPESGNGSSEMMLRVSDECLLWIRTQIGWRPELQKQWLNNRGKCDLSLTELPAEENTPSVASQK